MHFETTPLTIVQSNMFESQVKAVIGEGQYIKTPVTRHRRVFFCTGINGAQFNACQELEDSVRAEDAVTVEGPMGLMMA